MRIPHQYPEEMVISSNEIHLWHVNVSDVTRSIYQHLKKFLSPAETQRASKFQFQKDRRLFVISRGYLRQLLASYLTIEPYQINFAYEPHGKPSIQTSSSVRNIKFNISHSGSHVVYAVTLDEEIGIDVEEFQVNLAKDIDITMILSAKELLKWEKMPPNRRSLAFLRYWVCKEATLKALGQGFSCQFSEVEINLEDDPVTLLKLGPDEETKQSWTLQEFRWGKFIGAVAIRSKTKKISLSSCL